MNGNELQILEILTFILGVALLSVAFFQWRTNEDQRKQSLFDKRWDYYQRAKKSFLDDFILHVKGKEKTYIDRHLENYSTHYADEGFFLFGKDIEDHVRKEVFKILSRLGENTIEDPILSFRKPFEKYLKIK